MTANDALMDEAIQLGLVLDRLALNSTGRVLDKLNALSDELAVLVIKTDPTAVVRETSRRARLETLVEQMDRAIQDAYRQIESQVNKDLNDAATLTQDSLSLLLALLLLIKGLSRQLDNAALSSVRQDVLVSGATIPEWWDRQAEDMKFRTRRVLEDALRLTQIGKEPGTGDLVGAIKDTSAGSLFSAAPRHAQGLVRSAFHAVANRVRFEMILRHPELFRAFQHVSVLDGRTCLVSGTMLKTPDGDLPIEKIKTGETIIGGSRQERKVLGTLSKPVKKMVRVTMDDGTTIVCTPDHLFLTEDGIQSWKEAQDLRSGEEIATMLK